MPHNATVTIKRLKQIRKCTKTIERAYCKYKSQYSLQSLINYMFKTIILYYVLVFSKRTLAINLSQLLRTFPDWFQILSL